MTTWNLSGTKHHVLICNGSSCMRKGGEEVTHAIREEIQKLELDNQIHTSRTRCNGRCKDACVVIAYPEGVWYGVTSPDAGRDIIKNYLLEGTPIKESLIYMFSDEQMIPSKYAELNEGIRKSEKKVK
ncbi:(2Fe-2S) ferredoxin [Thalassobacillus cyri]|uniref:(2Fe-2S) ferredoxin n=1 Tax=Thalassobacillus cyri TaxID=571932 RepID=A0A1H4GY40_9BACI|nr:(2Fe-2S) ferredoxin domain-containing protein [Thalassobacillus cyri]SEB13642.1 (2Fe-2S) ferredoxin [Thalassobacillus cyri]